MKVKTNLNQSTILITGVAGFIGAALTQRILREYQDCYVVGLDNLNDYYDPALKEYRCTENKKAEHEGSCKYHFIQGSIADKSLVDNLFREYSFDIVVNARTMATR